MRWREVLQVVSSQVDTKELPQQGLGWVGRAVVVRNQAVSPHQHSREAQHQVAHVVLHDRTGSDFRTKCHTRHAITALTR